MKKPIYSIAILIVLLFACNGLTIITTPPATKPPIATEPPATRNVTCNKVSLFLDRALASGFNCATIPEANVVPRPDSGINPEYTQITPQGYLLQNTHISPQIDVFPIQRYRELLPERISSDVTKLQGFISGTAPANEELPVLPAPYARQEFYAQYKVIPFSNGSGIRYLTQYAQAMYPINNTDMSYYFQGLTSDGQYWVSIILPISSPILSPDDNTPPDGQTWEQFYNNFDAYTADITKQLNAQPPDSLSPTLSALDALVASITIQP